MFRSFAPIVLFLLLSGMPAAAQPADTSRIWRDFMEWSKAQAGKDSSWNDYRARLIEGGLTPAQADERVALIPRLIQENPAYREEISTLSFNQLYRASQQNRFTLEPNAFLVSVVKDLKPGRALDVAMGQGRNAVYLATRGWEVTGFDLAEDGLRVAEANAVRAGVRIRTVKARFEDFDYGREQWDLIYFVYTDAPTADPKYVARLQAALKPGGLMLLDRPYRSLTNPEPGWVETEEDKVNAHVKAWAGMQIVFYEDTIGHAEWRQTSAPRLEQKLRLVRILARKL